MMVKQKLVGVLLFDEFETLDVFGPVEKNSHGVAVDSLPLAVITDGVDIFLIPGGYGTRRDVLREDFLAAIKHIAEKSRTPYAEGLAVHIEYNWHREQGNNF